MLRRKMNTALLALFCMSGSVMAACGEDPDPTNAGTKPTPDVSFIPESDLDDADLPELDLGDADMTAPDADMEVVSGVCGDGTVNMGELCDGDCAEDQAACDDGDPCTNDFLEGSAANCDATCTHVTVATCSMPGMTGSACQSDADCNENGVCANEADNGFPGGYCVRGCRTDADCDAGAHCDTELKACTADCTTTAECRAGSYVCGDRDGNGTTECWPGGPGEGAVGDACVDRSSCGGGIGGICITSLLDGYCSKTCRNDAECGAGSHCAYINASSGSGICLDACAADSDCARDGYFCGDSDGDRVNECLPGASGAGAVGDACTELSDCGGGADGLCLEEDGSNLPGGYCTIFCMSDAACGAGAHCDSEYNVCVADCASDADCRMDAYVCGDRDGNGNSECWPGSNGPGALGDPCVTLSDCGGGIGATCLDADYNGFFEGYCSLGCTSDAACGVGNHCALIDASTGVGTCLETCVDDTECTRSGYVCGRADNDAVRECVTGAGGSGAVGDACSAITDCGGGSDGRCLDQTNSGFFEGYCTILCTSDAACGPGNHCGYINASSGAGICLADCVADSDCGRSGYLCGDADGNGDTECVTGGGGSGAVGEACADISECGGGLGAFCGTELSEGYCSLRCTSDAACGAGNHCGYIDPMTGSGVCLAACASDADCGRAGYFCNDTDGNGNTECWPGGVGNGAVGATCTNLSDCGGGANGRCVEASAGFPGGYCTIDCMNDAACGAGAHCDSAYNVCVADCTSDADCRTDAYICEDRDGNGNTECWPGSSGSGAPGTPCGDTQECAGRLNAICFAEANNPPIVDGYCSQNCTASDICPAGSACVLLRQDGSLSGCLDTCSVDADCRTGYRCVNDGFGSRVCWL